MQASDRVVLKEVPDGKIELVFNGTFMVLEFNAPCMQVIDVCRAMCCRLRTSFCVLLKKDEVGRFKSVPYPRNEHFQILPHDEKGACVYLSGDDLCGVHSSGKPWVCATWHCSPHGGLGDEKIKHRDGGWLLTPFKLKENIDDEGTVLDWEKVFAQEGR